MRESVRTLILVAGFLAALTATVLLMEAGLPRLPSVVIPFSLAMWGWFRMDRPCELAATRRAKGLCVRCGYDLTGNVIGVRPECGEEPTSPPGALRDA